MIPAHTGYRCCTVYSTGTSTVQYTSLRDLRVAIPRDLRVAIPRDLRVAIPTVLLYSTGASVPVIRVGPSGYFTYVMHIYTSITMPIASAFNAPVSRGHRGTRKDLSVEIEQGGTAV